jgi:threonine dehydrogenase-like Zn-dependent dehydrogenase
MAGGGGKMMAPQSGDKTVTARALWYARKGVVELREAPLPGLRPGQARVRALYSGISRGTERLVFNGSVGVSEWETMRGPNQEGDFPFPVKYGYCATGIVEAGPDALIGRSVFCLHPHQDVFQVAADQVTPIPEGIPPRRATLAANMETALNAFWDSGAAPGNRIVVIGAGIVGLLLTSLLARQPLPATTVDTDATRKPLVEALGGTYAAEAPGGADVVFHASATAAGLNAAINCTAFEGTIVEMSWYGDKPVTLHLGGAFHSRRLKLVSSQVGHVAASRRVDWSYARRREAALALLAAPELDRLVDQEIAFENAPAAMPAIFADGARGLAPVIRYPQTRG